MDRLERSDSTDSIEKELDWLIQKDEEEGLNAEKQVRQIWWSLYIVVFLVTLLSWFLTRLPFKPSMHCMWNLSLRIIQF